MTRLFVILVCCLSLYGGIAKSAQYVETPYTAQKVVFDFYFNHPENISTALYWIRSWMKPLIDSDSGYSPDDLNAVIIIHGTEIVTIAKKNYKKYKNAVERMRYYADLGFEFKVCNLAMGDFGYEAKDLHNFIQVVPSAMAELVHWQHKGYALITPVVFERKFAIEEIR